MCYSLCMSSFFFYQNQTLMHIVFPQRTNVEKKKQIYLIAYGLLYHHLLKNKKKLF